MLAALVQYLASGARKSDGSANASGLAWFYSPGTTSQTIVYSDADAEVQATQPIALDAAGKAEVYLAGPARLVVQSVTSTGVYSTVDDFDVVTASAPSTAVRNDGFTGVDPDTGSTVAGGDTTLHAVLTSLNTSTGGVDAKYQESTAASARTIKAKFSEIWISVKDYGAIGNGIADDTTAIQNAINRVVFLGGGTVYFPPTSTSYLVSSVLTATSANGLRLLGAGKRSSQIKLTHATANCFTFTSCSTLCMEHLNLTHSSSTTGFGIALVGCTDTLINAVGVDGVTFSGTYTTALSITGASVSGIRVTNCDMQKGVVVNTSGTSQYFFFTNNRLPSGGNALDFDGTASNVFISNNQIGAVLRLKATLTGTNYFINNNQGLATQGTISVLTATDPGVFQKNNNRDHSVTSFAVGTSQTPDIGDGAKFIYLAATSGGAGAVTVNAPTPADAGFEREFVLVFINASGGAVTWNLNAAYRTTAAIPATAGHTITVGFATDKNVGGVYRELYRADSVT